jgi:succinate-semialdehyde dehydrogenase / glutarate-semialdehyde dehydrogenase
MAIRTVNPATGEVVKTYDEMTDGELEAALDAAAAAFRDYRRTTFEQRAGWLRAAADILDAERDAVAALMTTEMGKPIGQARAEAAKCAAACRYYAEHAEGYLAPEPADPAAVGAREAYAIYQPLGVVLAVMPWNFPLWQAMRFAAPALMAGNVGLLKHASNVPGSALYLAGLFRRAGFPAGAFQTLLIGSGRVERVLTDPRVAAATLTGSGPAGAAVAAAAGRAIKKTVLELGGSDPFIVMPSADIDAAARAATKARCQNNGQSCIAAKRFIVHADVAGEFTDAFVKAMSSLTVGDPFSDGVDVGPLATAEGRDDLDELVRDAVERGATVLTGGQVPAGVGWYYPPTVLTDLTADMRLFGAEAFGPVAALFTVASAEEAVAIGNATEFGLGANAWTNDPAEREFFIRDLEAGAVFINGMVTSYPQLPFGGVKTSGYGRELSAHGIREFCGIKAVWVG